MNQLNFKKILSTCISVLHIFFIVLMIAIGVLSIFSPETIKIAIDWMGKQIQSWWNWNYLILFSVALIESFPFVWVVVPGMNLMILVGGFFVAKQWSLFPLAASMAMLWACLGNALGYIMGYYGNPDTMQKYGKLFGMWEKEMTWLKNQIHKNGFWFIVGGKFHNLLRSFMPYLAGSHKMSGSRFWTANIFGSSLWAVLILLMGIFFIENYEIILTYLNYWILAIIVVGVMIYSVRESRKK